MDSISTWDTPLSECSMLAGGTAEMGRAHQVLARFKNAGLCCFIRHLLDFLLLILDHLRSNCLLLRKYILGRVMSHRRFVG